MVSAWNHSALRSRPMGHREAPRPPSDDPILAAPTPLYNDDFGAVSFAVLLY